MGSSKKHKEKHRKKEKKRRRSRSRSAERRRSTSRSRSRSPARKNKSIVDESHSKYDERSLREFGSKRRTDYEDGYSYSAQSKTSGDYEKQGLEAHRIRYEDVKVKVEPDSDLYKESRGFGTESEVQNTSTIKRVKSEPSDGSMERTSSQRDQDDWNRDREYQLEVERKRRAREKEKRREQRREEMESHQDNVGAIATQGPSSGGDVALSIEETNKLRAQLGLKPLDVGSSGEQGAPAEKSYEDRDDVHIPAINLSEQKTAVKVKERLEEMREKRKMQKKLQKVKPLALADDDPVLESAAAWVAKSRQIEQEKMLAEKRAQLLEEMDDEFGISGIADQMLGRKDKSKDYTSADLKGLRVEHSAAEFSDDRAVVLTLKDKGVLDEEEDVLENVNIVDDRKALKNVENKKKLPAYRPYDEPDEDGMLKPKEVLEKYDQVIDGEQKKSFRLDALGRADDEDDRELERIRANLREQQVSLQSNERQRALDYYTTEEMVKFNKPKKRRKVRKREIVKADDLLPLGGEQGRDHGSRNPQALASRSARATDNFQESVSMDISDEETDNARQESASLDLMDDDAELQLQLALQRSRKAKLRDKDATTGIEKVAQFVLEQTEKESESVPDRKSRGTIVLDSTSEFCRTLGEVPTVEKQIKEEPEDEDMMYAGQEYDAKAGGWSRVYETKAKAKAEPKSTENVLDAEPIASHGVASALSLATMKGYLEAEKKKEIKKANLNFPETKAFIDEEKMRDDERDRHHRYDPYGFKEKEGYKPDVKLEYVDESGRLLTPKEAFRYLSHKFHGKGSGKMKTEKRVKKQTEEAKLEQMSAIDTPLGTVKMMSERQKQASTPYVVLSGGGKNLLSSERISKK